MISCNSLDSDREFHNFNTLFEIDLCRYRVYYHDFFCRVFYNYFCRDHRFDYFSELHFMMHQNQYDRFDDKIEIDIT